MASRDAELRRRESALADRADELRSWERRLRAREGELTASRARWSAAWRVALSPVRALQVMLGVWLTLGATVLGGYVLVASAVAAGLVLTLGAMRCMSLPAGVPPEHRGVVARLRARLGHATAPAR